MLPTKNDFYFTILKLISQGKNPSEIAEFLNIPKQNIYYYTRKLKRLGFLKKINNIWVVVSSKKADLEHAMSWEDKKIRGHAFIWKVKPSRKYDWKLLLEKKSIKYNLLKNGTVRLFINDKKVWLGKETITVYENKSFYAKNAIESRKYAVYELSRTMEILMNKFGINFTYVFSVSREHFSLIKNDLAKQVNADGEKIIIRDTLDGEWLWIDNSHGMLHELETGGKGVTKDRAYLNMQLQRWWNEQKATNFEVTPSFLVEKFKQTNENFQELSQLTLRGSKESLGQGMLIKQMQSDIKGLTEAVYQLAEVIKDNHK